MKPSAVTLTEAKRLTAELDAAARSAEGAMYDLAVQALNCQKRQVWRPLGFNGFYEWLKVRPASVSHLYSYMANVKRLRGKVPEKLLRAMPERNIRALASSNMPDRAFKDVKLIEAAATEPPRKWLPMAAEYDASLKAALSSDYRSFKLLNLEKTQYDAMMEAERAAIEDEGLDPDAEASRKIAWERIASDYLAGRAVPVRAHDALAREERPGLRAHD